MYKLTRAITFILLFWATAFFNACARYSDVQIRQTPGVLVSANASGGNQILSGSNLNWLGQYGVLYKVAIVFTENPTEGELIQTWLGGNKIPGDSGFTVVLANVNQFFLCICSSDTTYYSKKTCTNAVPAQ